MRAYRTHCGGTETDDGEQEVLIMAFADAGANNTTLKQRNRGVVLRLIATKEAVSRIDLARATGLSKMATTNIISELMREDIVSEQEKLRVDSRGRNPVSLTISENAPLLVGLLIGKKEIAAGLYDLYLHPVAEEVMPVRSDKKEEPQRTALEAAKRILRAAEGKRVYGIGVATRDLSVAGAIAAEYGLPVFADNPFHGAALLEQYYGAARQDANAIVVTGNGKSTGAGILLYGTLYRSTEGKSAEIAAADMTNPESLREALLPAVRLLHPQRIVLADTAKAIPEAACHRLQEMLRTEEGSEVLVEASGAGKDILKYGAACILLEQVFEGVYF